MGAPQILFEVITGVLSLAFKGLINGPNAQIVDAYIDRTVLFLDLLDLSQG